MREKVIPYQYQVLEDKLEGVEKSHALENLRLAAQKNRGETFPGSFTAWCSKTATWPNGWRRPLFLGQCPNPALEREVDSVVELLAQVQQEDGYLNSYFTVKEPDRRWTNLQEAHELYCAGHLMEAACAYYEATGKDRFLKIMEKTGTASTAALWRCAPGASPATRRSSWPDAPVPGHGQREVQGALRPLHRRAGPGAQLFHRGAKTRGWNVWGNDSLDTDYTQSTKPVREQEDAVGHAVRACTCTPAWRTWPRSPGTRA